MPSSKMVPANGKISIAPSLLSADLFDLKQDIRRVEEAGADWLHVDVMDGNFVPNLSFGPALVASLNGRTKLPLDVHLMVQEPARFAESFAKAGADVITIHLEARDNVRATLEKIKARGVFAGVSIKPDTKPQALAPYMDLLDLILVMSVYPGFGGQAFLPGSPEQIQGVREVIRQSGRPVWLEVDGGINKDTAALAARAGADALVAGSAIFKAADPVLALKQIRQAASDI